MWENCYKMKLGDVIRNNATRRYLDEEIMRVPGGWVYSRKDFGELECTFIPFDNEFMKREVSE